MICLMWQRNLGFGHCNFPPNEVRDYGNVLHSIEFVMIKINKICGNNKLKQIMNKILIRKLWLIWNKKKMENERK